MCIRDRLQHAEQRVGEDLLAFKIRDDAAEKQVRVAVSYTHLDVYKRQEEISGLAFAPDGVSIIATVSGKSGERKVTVTREGSA